MLSKKRFVLLISILICFFLMVSSCSKANEKDQQGQTEKPTTSASEGAGKDIPNGTVRLTSDLGCRIVYADGYKSVALKLYDKLIALDEQGSMKIGFYETSAKSSDDGKVEIHIGDTASAASASAMAALEEFFDYSVGVEYKEGAGLQMAIFAYADASFEKAIDFFIDGAQYVDGIGVVSKYVKTVSVKEQIDYPLKDLTVGGRAISDYAIVYAADAQPYEAVMAENLFKLIGENTGKALKVLTDAEPESEYEILVGRTSREASAKVYSNVGVSDYSLTFDGSKAVLAGGSELAMFILGERVAELAEQNKDISENISDKVREDIMIVSQIPQLRDPCILLDNGVYYAYGTGWVCYMNTSGRLDGEWTSLGRVVSVPEDAGDCYWAPEVHKYNGLYYMFTTYKSKETGHRGCTVLRSDNPQGPFFEISDGHVTPADWDAIDGTLYIDKEGAPWMVFVHEWTSTDDGVGRMAAAKMSDDLTRFITEPIELFRADDPSWSRNNVTDGCWMYRCENGELLMIWSNWDPYGYCVGIARSDNGEIDGNWTQDDELLYSKSMTGEYDGGHGMIFTSINGQMYLSIHSPNNAGDGRKETPVFIAICEKNGTLVWDQW